MTLSGKRALITGGAVRLGRAVVQALQAEAVQVVVHCNRSWATADLLSPYTIQADLSEAAEAEALIDRVHDTFGKIDILVNNAAVFHQATLAEADTKTVLREFGPNLLAPLVLTRAFSAQTESGKIINVLDRRIRAHDTSAVPYQLSKKALEELTKLSAVELAPGITVNAVAPGPVLPPPKTDEDTWEYAGKIPLESRPLSREVAEAVTYLLKADSVTGQILFIDGGQHLLGNGV